MSIPKEMSRDILLACIIEQFGTDGKIVIKGETAKKVLKAPHNHLPIGDEIVGDDFVIMHKPLPKEILDMLNELLGSDNHV